MEIIEAFRGSEYESPDKPIRLGVLNIKGVQVHYAVFPQEISSKGRPYNPVRAYIPRESPLQLVAVDEDGNIVDDDDIEVTNGRDTY